MRKIEKKYNAIIGNKLKMKQKRMFSIDAEGMDFIAKKQKSTIMYHAQAYVRLILRTSLKTDEIFTQHRNCKAIRLKKKYSTMNPRIPENLTGSE